SRMANSFGFMGCRVRGCSARLGAALQRFLHGRFWSSRCHPQVRNLAYCAEAGVLHRGPALMTKVSHPGASLFLGVFHQPIGKPMKALTYQGAKDVRVETVPDPVLEASDDVVLRVTATAICGSDLHIYRGNIPAMKDGDILGHEFMGVVEEVGPGVTNLRPGD